MWEGADFSEVGISRRYKTGMENHNHMTGRMLTPGLKKLTIASKYTISEPLRFIQI